VKSIIIKLKGKTSHAAEPDKGLNPANMISELVQYFDTLNNLDSTNSKFYIATPIHINLGSKDYGISAGEGELHYTLRANNHLHFQNNTEKITDKIEQLAKKYKMRFEISWTEEFSANINDKEAFTLLKDVATSNDLEFKIINYPMKWGEDFGIFTQKYKGAMFGIGIGEDKPALHNPDYDFNDNIIATGIKMFFGILEQLNKSK
jgi:metal-dependent amidase/aminoacylase/carboxypeptidase family protein